MRLHQIHVRHAQAKETDCMDEQKILCFCDEKDLDEWLTEANAEVDHMRALCWY